MQADTRALARNTYSLDTAGVLAHLRDTTRAYVTRIARGRSLDVPERASLPRSRVGPPREDVLVRNHITDVWRLR